MALRELLGGAAAGLLDAAALVCADSRDAAESVGSLSGELGLEVVEVDIVAAMLESPQDLRRWIMNSVARAVETTARASVILVMDAPAWIPAKDAREELLGAFLLGMRILRERGRPYMLLLHAKSREDLERMHPAFRDLVQDTVELAATDGSLGDLRQRLSGILAQISGDKVILPSHVTLPRQWSELTGAQTHLMARRIATRVLARQNGDEARVAVQDDDLAAVASSQGQTAMRRAQAMPKESRVTWDDIGGYARVKALLQESVIWFHRHADAFARLGIQPPKGVLLYGPPGTGKTLMARAVASESGADFLLLSLPELVHGHVGDSEKALAAAFREARKRAPCIIFLDEIDALFQRRDGAGDLNAKLVSQVAMELDALRWDSAQVVFLAATNHPEMLDASLLRPGRIDRAIEVGPAGAADLSPWPRSPLPAFPEAVHRRPSIFDVFERSATHVRKSFQFMLAAAGKAKGSDVVVKSPPPGQSEYASVQVGEDSYFMRPDSMGVADGVGGWSEVKGANAALYSLKMMHYAHSEFEKYDDLTIIDYTVDDYATVSPKDVLARAYQRVNEDAAREKLLGSTTALIVVLRDNELRVANLGDCGIMVVRGHEAIFRNEEQQHSFNFPYQLGTISKDSPADAQLFTIKVQEGDIVVLGTDGLFDNVFDEEIVDIIGVHTHASKPELSDPQRMTDALLFRAREVAEDNRSASSPFQTRAIQEGFYYQGGKMDDVTVLVGIIRVSEDSPDRR